VASHSFLPLTVTAANQFSDLPGSGKESVARKKERCQTRNWEQCITDFLSSGASLVTPIQKLCQVTNPFPDNQSEGIPLNL